LSETQRAEGYRGAGLELLQRFGAKVGQRVQVETIDGLQVAGLLIPRYEYADDGHIVLKLKSGYNIGLKVSDIRKLEVREDVARNPFRIIEKQPIPFAKEAKKLLLISTGGTIASRVDYRTGAVYPALSASDLYSAVPELDEIASIEPEVVFSTYSENMSPSHWQTLSEKIIALARLKKPDGIVIMMGTDSLGYSAAALSFSLMGFSTPVVFVGAQRSPDRPSSDAALNLSAAAYFAVNSKRPGVYLAMHETENDDFIAIHSGVRGRKNHTSRRDAFESVDVPLLARVHGKEILWIESSGVFQVNPAKQELTVKTNFDGSVALVKFHPGYDPETLQFLVKERKVKGVIIEGTGLGHVSDKVVSEISKLVKEGVFVGMTSQCIWGRVDLNVYATGMDLLAAGVTPLENMLGETAFAKLSWAMGNFEDPKSVMLENYLGEFEPKLLLEL
jgi:glutamyl-tRNA(Gln) amidotransferase subunit D